MAATSERSAVTAMVLLPSAATKSVTLLPVPDSIAAARPSFPSNQRPMSSTAWVITTFGTCLPFVMVRRRLGDEHLAHHLGRDDSTGDLASGWPGALVARPN